MKKLITVLLAFGALTLNAFGAGLTVTSPVSAGGTQLKPGAYKFEVKDNKLILKDGRTLVAEVPVTTETAAKKFADTTYEATDGKITAIRVGGSTTRIVLK
jgi:hypothetical protein